MGTLKWIEGTASYFTYFQLVLGGLMIVTYFHQKKFQYLTIENGLLIKNSLKRKTIQLDKIEQIQSIPGRIKIFTSEKSLSINTSILDEDSLKDLYQILGSLELEQQENPFIGWSKAEI